MLVVEVELKSFVFETMSALDGIVRDEVSVEVAKLNWEVRSELELLYVFTSVVVGIKFVAVAEGDAELLSCSMPVLLLLGSDSIVVNPEADVDLVVWPVLEAVLESISDVVWFAETLEVTAAEVCDMLGAVLDRFPGKLLVLNSLVVCSVAERLNRAAEVLLEVEELRLSGGDVIVASIKVVPLYELT